MYHDKIIQTLLHNAVCRVLTSTSQSKHRGYCRKGDLRIWYTSCSNPVNTRCHGVFSNYLFNSLTAQKSESTGGLIRKEPLSEGRAFLKRCSSHVLWRKFLDSCASNFQSQWQVTCNDYYLKILQRDPYILMFSHCICQFDGIKKCWSAADSVSESQGCGAPAALQQQDLTLKRQLLNLPSDPHSWQLSGNNDDFLL